MFLVALTPDGRVRSQWTIQESPQTPAPIPLAAVPITGPVYASIRGTDRFCVYPVTRVHGPELIDPRGPDYGRTSAFSGTQPAYFPVGVLIDTFGIAHGPTVPTRAWHMIGHRGALQAHLETVTTIAHTLAAHGDAWERSAATAADAPPAAQTEPSAATATLRELLDWMQHDPAGLPNAATLLAGVSIAATTHPAFAAGTIAMATTGDRIEVSPQFLHAVTRGRYALAASTLWHEWIHLRPESPADGWHEPVTTLVRAGVRVYGDLMLCPQHAVCGALGHLRPAVEHRLGRALFRDAAGRARNAVEEAIAYAGQLAQAAQFEPTTQHMVIRHVKIARDRSLQQITTGHIPVGAYRLARAYYREHVRTVLQDLDALDQFVPLTRPFEKYLVATE